MRLLTKFLRVQIAICGLMCIMFSQALAQDAPGQDNENMVIQDLKRFWVTYDDAYESYRPYFTGSEAAQNSISFYLDGRRFKPYSLALTLPSGSYVFINNALAGHFPNEGRHYLNIDSLIKKYHSDSLFFTIFNEYKAADVAETVITRQSLLASLGLADNNAFLNLRDRETDYFKEVFITLCIGWLVLLAVGYNLFEKSYREFFSWGRAFAMRLREENVLKNRPFSRENIMFFVVYSYLFSLIFFSVKHYFRPDAPWFDFISFGNYPQAMVSFVLFMTGIFILLLAKYLLLINMGAIFDLRNLIIVHFIDYVRISLVLYSVVLAILVIIFLSDIGIGLTVTHVVYLLIASALLRVVVVFFKLANNSNYKFVHLFSYLCTTEIAPLVVALKFLLK